MYKVTSIFLVLFFLLSCSKNDDTPSIITQGDAEFIYGVDISQYPKIRETTPSFMNAMGEEADFLAILKNNGVNTVRLKLWVNPISEYESLESVAAFARTLKDHDFKIWLSLHYSDSWADPAKQVAPSPWRNLDLQILRDSVYSYTARVVNQIDPEYIQIGNEINNGFLFPHGSRWDNLSGFLSLLKNGVAAVRDNASTTQIILHYAGHENASEFFAAVEEVDYDIIGLSYYPIWHGKSVSALGLSMNNLSATFNKKIVIAETAYPFTLDWNDWTHNIVGLEEQLILPEFPATESGQKTFIQEIKNTCQQLDQGLGFCYWGAEFIAWDGTESENGSPWENQALFDFNRKALPALEEFGVE